jgi:hypothetical protein
MASHARLLCFEDGERLILLAGIPPRWLEQPDQLAVKGLQTYFGVCSFSYSGSANSGIASVQWKCGSARRIYFAVAQEPKC